MADPELGKDLTAEQEEFTAKYEFLSHRFFKFNNSNLPSSARNIHFVCLLCPRKTLIACSKKNTANLRMHIERQHGMHLEVKKNEHFWPLSLFWKYFYTYGNMYLSV